MASDTFRSQMNSLGWSRRVDTPGATTTANTNGTTSSAPFLSRVQSFNPFGAGGYVRLPVSNQDVAREQQQQRAEEESCIMIVSRWDRILAFTICNLGALACFVICFALFPVLTLKPRKFAVLWTVGSALFLSSWAIMQGPIAYGRHLLSAQRMPFTVAYFGSIFLTLFFSIKVQSTILTLFAAILQLCALMWYLVSYFPMGSQGLRFASQMGARRAASWMQG
ncbi:Got1/Sft2-like family-domain-containing protein [Peziza echinospora]|nr:Got1/Sft2-like family-domain-containing protein [Peziza echinospora]